MSYGAISKLAVLALSNGARKAGCWMNTGEGGLSPYHLEGGADIVFQLGTAKNGARDLEGSLSEEKLRALAAHEQVKMFEIKLSQGAKPGKGGIFPGVKVTDEISKIRRIPAGHDASSPNRHMDVNSIDDLLGLIGRVRSATGKPTGFKAVTGAYGWLDGLCEALKRRRPKVGDGLLVQLEHSSGAAKQRLAVRSQGDATPIAIEQTTLQAFLQALHLHAYRRWSAEHRT